MQQVVLVIHLILAIVLIVVILLQRSEGGALGIGGGGGGSGALFSSRGAANILTRTTAIVATLFMLTSITLTILATQGAPEETLPGALPAVESPVERPQVPITE